MDLLGRIASACVPLALLSAAPAYAQESDGARLFREGRALMLEEKFAEACPKLEESQRLEPHTGTLLNVAACHERLGKIGSAWVEYQKAATAAHTEGQADREKLARARIGVIEPRVPWLTLAVEPAPSGLAVTLDGAEIAPGAWGKEMPVDPGPHAVAATAMNRPPYNERLDLREGERRTVRVAFASPDPAPEPLVVPPPEAPPPEKRAPRRNPYVIELDVLAGGLTVGSAQQPHDIGAVTIRASDGTQKPCSDSECPAVSSASSAFGIGVGGFLGYAVYDWLAAGIAGYGAISTANESGWFAAFGPAVSLRVTDAGASRALRIGIAGLMGAAVLQGQSSLNAPAGYSVVESSGRVEYHTYPGFAFGAALKLDYELVRLQRGALVATANPAVLRGDYGTGWLIALGAGYRFE